MIHEIMTHERMHQTLSGLEPDDEGPHVSPSTSSSVYDVAFARTENTPWPCFIDRTSTNASP